MSFLSELVDRKKSLKLTKTVVTKMDGVRFVESNASDDKVYICPTYGFVVDTKPDNVPALVIDNLYLGSQDCAASGILEAYNIKHVLSIGIKPEIDNINHKFVECLDLPETDIGKVLKECIPYINHALEKKENVLVHCNAGVSRAPMVTIGYLMAHKQMLFNEAHMLVKEKRPSIQLNVGFKKQLLVWDSKETSELP